MPQHVRVGMPEAGALARFFGLFDHSHTPLRYYAFRWLLSHGVNHMDTELVLYGAWSDELDQALVANYS